MLLADVIKIKCKFVDEIVNYLNRRKYEVAPCIKCKYTYYADALKLLHGVEDDEEVTLSCLDHDHVCDLETKASKYSSPSACVVGNVGCAEQASITLTQTNKTCYSTAVTNNPVCSCKYPNITLTNDSEYIEANINVRYTFSGTCATPPTTNSVLVEGGCTSSGCSTDYQGIYSFGFNSDGIAAINSASYLVQMKAFTYDPVSQTTNAITLNLNPVTSPYLDDDPTDCPGCTPITTSELVFGHANFSSAFATLMDNVSIALFGTTGLHRMSAWWTNNKLRVRCRAVHNPSSELFGLRFQGSQLSIQTNNTLQYLGVNAFGDNDVYPHHRPIWFYDELNTLEAPNPYTCADISPIIDNQVTYPKFDTANSNFSKIVLASPIGLTAYPIEVSSGGSEGCSSITLNATFTADSTVSTYEWLDPDSNVVATDVTSIVPTQDGTYQFILTLENGCVIGETILVTGVSPS